MIFHKFPYLTMSLVLFAFFLAGLLLRPHERRPMLLSGLLQGPYALASILFVPDYWNPVRVAEGYLTGPEDIIFSVANGGLVWLFATWPIRNRMTLRPRLSRFAMAYGICALSGLVLVLLCWRSGISIMSSVLIAMIGVTAVLGLMQGRLWRIPVSGAIVFAGFYSVVIAATFRAFPEFVLQWNNSSLWGPTFLKVPIEEIVWALAFGAVWPFLMAYMLGAQCVEPVKPQTTSVNP